jgi:hypothetical protein
MWMRRAAAALVGAAVIAGCGSDDNPFADTPCSPTASKWAAASPPANLPVAPEKERVDRSAPSFSDPTRVTNALHPTSRLRSALLLGEAEGEPLRVEVTLLRRTKRLPCGEQKVKTLESQYVAFLGGRIHEVALDWYAQDDGGSVWYFGEDVFNFEDGVVADNEGTWLAGKDGPAAMIMPAEPAVGDVYRPENIPELVFEEVTVQKVGQTVEGPRGSVDGAIVVRELHQDGKFEDKTFAPGYGEFSTGAGNDLEAIALALPTDHRPGPVPPQLNRLLRGDLTAWRSYRTQQIPPLLKQQLGEAVARVDLLGVLHAALDLLLQYRPPPVIDRARFDLWTRQVQLDAAARDEGALKGDVATLERIADRFTHGPKLQSLLRQLRQEADRGAFAAAASTAARLRNNAASILSQ